MPLTASREFCTPTTMCCWHTSLDTRTTSLLCRHRYHPFLIPPSRTAMQENRYRFFRSTGHASPQKPSPISADGPGKLPPTAIETPDCHQRTPKSCTGLRKVPGVFLYTTPASACGAGQDFPGNSQILKLRVAHWHPNISC
jgi:hypothetical protein